MIPYASRTNLCCYPFLIPSESIFGSTARLTFMSDWTWTKKWEENIFEASYNLPISFSLDSFLEFLSLDLILHKCLSTGCRHWFYSRALLSAEKRVNEPFLIEKSYFMSNHFIARPWIFAFIQIKFMVVNNKL